MSDALALRGVHKRFGDRAALDGLDVRVPRGTVAAWVGPNGAGKTTAFSVLSGFLRPDRGVVEVLGMDPAEDGALKGRVGVLPQDAELPGRHPPRELLVHLARLGGLSAADAAREADRRLRDVGLADRVTDPIDALSHGMRRRVAVATALLGEPELVLLDEPTAGLDPVQARSLRALLAGLRGRATVVVSSHNLLELELLCDWVVVMDRGRCVRQGSMAEVTGRGERLTLSVSRPPPDPVALAQVAAGHTLEAGGDTIRVTLAAGADPDAVTLLVVGELCRQGVAVRDLRRGVGLEQGVLAGDPAGATFG